ncbi:hypothetical protein BGW80DRAFT_1316027 [Lactifluus volemus]|nr:hypothetical protein BGW80DRAFT_1316027 [Lactifluus volemus]
MFSSWTIMMCIVFCSTSALPQRAQLHDGLYLSITPALQLSPYAAGITTDSTRIDHIQARWRGGRCPEEVVVGDERRVPHPRPAAPAVPNPYSAESSS